MTIINYKNLIRSFWPIFYFGLLILLFIFYQVILNYFSQFTLGAWSRGNSYGEVLFLLLNYFLGVYSIQSTREFEFTLNISENELVLSKFIPCILFALKFILLNILYITVSGFRFGYSINYIFNVILHLIIIQLSISLVGISSGFIIGSIIKNKLAYILVFIPILLFTSFFNFYIFGYSYENELLSNYFNILDDDVNLIFQTSLGNVFDIKYFVDKILPVSITLVFMSLCLIFIRRKISFNKIVVLILGFVFLVAGTYLNKEFNYGNEFAYIPLHNEALKEKLAEYYSDIQITDITMNLKIDNTLENEVTYKIRNNNDNILDKIRFYFYKNFDIDSVTVNDIETEVVHQNEDLIIPLEINPDEIVDIKIKYNGKIKERLNPGILLYYSSKNSSNLIYSMNWYPIIEFNDDINYKLNVNYKNNLITNLNDFVVLDDGNSNLEGNAKYLYISTGFYQESQYDGKHYVGSEEVINKYLEEYEDIYAREIERINIENPEKIIIYPGSYFDNYKIDNFLMLSESY